MVVVLLKYKERIFDPENNISEAQIIFFMILPLLSVLSASILIFIKKEKWLFFPFALILLMLAINNYYSIFILSGYFIMLWESFNVLSNRPSLPKFWIIYAVVAVLYSAFSHSSIDLIGTNPVDFIIPNLNMVKLNNESVVDALIKGVSFSELEAAQRKLDKVNEIPELIEAIKVPLRIAFSMAFVMYLKWLLFQKRLVKEFFPDESEYESAIEDENIPENIEDTEKQRTYSSALKKMKVAQDEYDFTESAEMFASIEGYKNAKLLSEKCRKFSERARIFNNAQERMQKAKTVSEWKELSNIFASIKGFKNSDDLSKECLECADTLLQANSLRPIQKQKNSAKTQKIILISIIAFVVICSAAGLFVYQQKKAEEELAFREEIRQREMEREEELRIETVEKEKKIRLETERKKEEEIQEEIRKRNAVPQNLASIAKYLNLYGESKINYAEKCPEQIQQLASALSERMTYEELLKIINKAPSDLDGKHYTKVSDIASPQSVAKQKQAHKDYVPILVNDKTVKKGLEFFDEYRNTILKAYKETGVKPEDILGVLNWESKFGEYKGTFSVYQIFMGQICYLPEIEQNHFESGAYASNKVMKRPNALKRLEKLKKKSVENMAALISMAMDKHFNFYEIQGSWAGAIGIPQFMPSSMNFAADGDGDGEIDLNNMHDAIFSVATYLEQHGYKEQGPKHAFMAYNPEEMYVRGVSLYSQKIRDAGLTY
ncbi:lytic murein transglycosylase [bacterium]|nr:lytic murein transglycosylase [bacterium]